MAEEEVSYSINRTGSNERPITNLGDITAGLRSVLSGTVTNNSHTYNVDVRLPDEIAQRATGDGLYHFAMQELISEGLTDIDNRFNRLLDYLEHWINIGDLNMSDIKTYVNNNE